MYLKAAAYLYLAAGALFSQAQAGVNIGSTRVVYQGQEKEANLSILNTGEDNSPYLVQSWVSYFDGRDGTADEFIITPPLFRLDARQQNILRIISTGAQDLPSDKESLFLLNVKAIPAARTDQGRQNVLQIALKTTIKLFYRPAGLKGSLVEAVEKLSWSVEGGKLIVQNPSGFNVVVSELLINDRASKDAPEVIMPGSTIDTNIKLNVGDSLQLSYINEYGSTVKAVVIRPH